MINVSPIFSIKVSNTYPTKFRVQMADFKILKDYMESKVRSQANRKVKLKFFKRNFV